MKRRAGNRGEAATAALLAVTVSACGEPPPPRAAPPPPETAFGWEPVETEPEYARAPQARTASTSVPVEFVVHGSVARDWGERQTDTPGTHPLELPPLERRWQVRVGVTTFRTTMGVTARTLVIGTHGRSLEGTNEQDDGIYLVDVATGRVTSFIPTPGTGDRDVGGVAIDVREGGERTVAFGTDNGFVVLVAFPSNRVSWKSPTRGKVRPAPALASLNGDSTLDVVVGDETGVLRALDGRDGTKLWTVQTGTNDYGNGGFIAAAAIVDLDGDGRDDVVAGARDGVLGAYRGADGAILWQHEGKSGIHASPVVADFDLDGQPEVLAAWSYGDVKIFDGRTGELRWGTVVRQDDGGIEALFSTPIPVPGKPGALVVGTSWWGSDDGVLGVGVDERVFKSVENRVSSSAVVTDLDGDGTYEAIVGTEAGQLLAFHPDGGRAVLATLGGVEAPPMLADADGDGRYELYVASVDGTLSCFETPSTAPPAVPSFRGMPGANRGDVGKMRLGWRSRRPPPE